MKMGLILHTDILKDVPTFSPGYMLSAYHHPVEHNTGLLKLHVVIGFVKIYLQRRFLGNIQWGNLGISSCRQILAYFTGGLLMKTCPGDYLKDTFFCMY